jgi:hypothetical protein
LFGDLVWKGIYENSIFFDDGLDKGAALRARRKVTVLFDDVVDLETDLLRAVLVEVHLGGNDTAGVGHTKKVITQKFLQSLNERRQLPSPCRKQGTNLDYNDHFI